MTERGNVMIVSKNNISKVFMVGFLLVSSDCVLTGQQKEQKQPAQSSGSVTDPILSEQQIATYLQSKFVNLHVAPDVDVRVIARVVSNGNYTTAKLDQMIDSIQQRAKNIGSDRIAREHVSDVVHNKIDEYFYILLFYSLGIMNKQAVALHESGHAVALAYLLQDYRIITEASLFAPEYGGAFVNNMHRKDNWVADSSPDKVIHFYKNIIIMGLSGGVADQIFGLNGRTKLYVVVDWMVGRQRHENIGLQGILNGSDYKGDAQKVISVAQHLNEYYTDQTVDQILEECYEKAYQFILDHKDEVKKIADLLMVKGTVFGNEIYDLLGLPMPKFDFEEEVMVSTEIENVAPSAQNSLKNQIVRLKSPVLQHKKRKK